MKRSDARMLIRSIAAAVKARFAPKAELRALAARVERLEKSLKSAPQMRYRGIFRDGDEYPAGTFITHQGSVWFTDKATGARPGDTGSAWVLAVKRGRDGR